LKKIHASSDKKNSIEGFLPAEILWRTAELICQKGVQIPPIDAEPAPLEMLGATIGILRRRKHISYSSFAQRIGCSVEELLALEAGLLPASDLLQYLPLILRVLKLREKSVQPFLRDLKIS